LSTEVTGVTEARPLRADARRNRDALLVAAAAQFAERGVEAPLEDIEARPIRHPGRKSPRRPG